MSRENHSDRSIVAKVTVRVPGRKGYLRGILDKDTGEVSRPTNFKRTKQNCYSHYAALLPDGHSDKVCIKGNIPYPYRVTHITERPVFFSFTIKGFQWNDWTSPKKPGKHGKKGRRDKDLPSISSLRECGYKTDVDYAKPGRDQLTYAMPHILDLVYEYFRSNQIRRPEDVWKHTSIKFFN